MDDKTHPDCVDVANATLQDHATHLERPAWSPDSDLIEHAWDIIGKEVCGCCQATLSFLTTWK